MARTRPPGRIRTKLARMLTERLGFEVNPADIWEQVGAYRTKKLHDALAWGVNADIGCWDSMGSCVRNGFDVTYKAGFRETASGCAIHIDARPSTPISTHPRRGA